MFVDDGAELSLTELVAPRVEAELAFVMASDLVGPGVTTDDALGGDRRRAARARGRRQPDRRLAEPDRRHRRRQRGRRPGGARRRTRPSRAWTCGCWGCCSRRNGTPIDSGAGAAALGHPAAALGLAGQHARRASASGLRRGDVVLAGALTGWCPARPGDRFAAEFAHLGTVSVRFGAPVTTQPTDPQHHGRGAAGRRARPHPDRAVQQAATRSCPPPSATRRRSWSSADRPASGSSGSSWA